MLFGGRKATVLLFLGDILVFALSLWITLLLRYGGLPTREMLALHAGPFFMLFCLWVFVFYISGLYGKQVIRFRTELWGAIVRTQVFNIVLAALFFFLTPQIGITPKTNLAIYLAVSLVGVCVWRLGIFPRITVPSRRVGAALIGSGPEVDELFREVNGNPRYPLQFVVRADAALLARDFAAFTEDVQKHKVSVLIVDADHDAVRAVLPQIYRLTVRNPHYQFLDFYRVYEEVFDRVPLSLLRYEWFLKNASRRGPGAYALAKRLIDLVGGALMAVITVLITPVVALALQLEYPGPVFIVQNRIGVRGARIRTYKFRSMRFGDRSAWQGEDENKVTRVGSFLRKTSLDEFPQCINILRGEISLIGPRNDLEALAVRLAEEIPYYNVRYGVKPGITGWAQINQRYESGNISPQSVEETKVRLAYDFYYIKHRSLSLDLVIALKTLKRMLFRVSSW